jgi:hypothetical protein
VFNTFPAHHQRSKTSRDIQCVLFIWLFLPKSFLTCLNHSSNKTNWKKIDVVKSFIMGHYHIYMLQSQIVIVQVVKLMNISLHEQLISRVKQTRTWWQVILCACMSAFGHEHLRLLVFCLYLHCFTKRLLEFFFALSLFLGYLLPGGCTTTLGLPSA